MILGNLREGGPNKWKKVECIPTLPFEIGTGEMFPVLIPEAGDVIRPKELALLARHVLAQFELLSCLFCAGGSVEPAAAR